MPYLDVAIYREREKQWRESAADLSPGPERDACIALAERYAKLVAILERLGQDNNRPPGGDHRESSHSHLGS
jgi:hypothetical protein